MKSREDSEQASATGIAASTAIGKSIERRFRHLEYELCKTTQMSLIGLIGPFRYVYALVWDEQLDVSINRKCSCMEDERLEVEMRLSVQ